MSKLLLATVSLDMRPSRSRAPRSTRLLAAIAALVTTATFYLLVARGALPDALTHTLTSRTPMASKRSKASKTATSPLQASARATSRRGPPKTTQHGPLTPSQRRILEAILFSIQQGQIPTIREIGNLVGLSSSATVFKHLRTLQTKELITVNRKSRSIRIADPQRVREALLESAPPSSSSSTTAPPPLFPNLRLDAAGSIAGAHLLQAPTGKAEAAILSFPAAGQPAASGAIPIVGAIAAGKPFESYADGYLPDGVGENGFYPEGSGTQTAADTIPMSPALFSSNGEVFALRVHGDSMINAGILDGDYVMIRKQSTVEEGEIAAVIINGEGTLKRWKTYAQGSKRGVRLLPENERFDPIDITEDEAKDVIVFGKYVGLVRGNLRFL